jgi:hypothetical protein
MHGAIGVWLRWCTHPLVGGSDVSCHVICCDIRSEHAVLDAGVVCARAVGGGMKRSFAPL